MAESIQISKEEFRRRLRSYGMSETYIEQTSRAFEKNNNHLDVIAFVIMLERYGMFRRNIRDFLKDAGLDDTTLINIFGKVDVRKSNVSFGDIAQVALED